MILMALTKSMYFFGVPVEFALFVKAVVVVIVVLIQSPVTRKIFGSRITSKGRGVAVIE
jgi:type IV secretory pathway VirB3-like protein